MKKSLKYFFTGFLYLSMQAVFAQIATTPAATPNPINAPKADAANEAGPVLNHIAVYVNDLQKSADFYREIVGLREIPEPFKDNLHVWFSIGSSQLHLIAGAPAPDPKRNKYNHLCFSVQSIDDFIDRLRAHDIEYSNWAGESQEVTLRVDGVKQIYFKDPDGYWIEVNNDR